jgi:hypothetical protein
MDEAVKEKPELSEEKLESLKRAREANRSQQFSKSQLAAAIGILYHMRGDSFGKEAMPRLAMSKMLGINRWRMIRVIQSAQGAMALAIALNKRLERYDKAPKKTLGRPPGSKNKPGVEDREDKRKRENDAQDFRTKGKRNRNMSLRPLRTGDSEEG